MFFCFQAHWSRLSIDDLVKSLWNAPRRAPKTPNDAQSGIQITQSSFQDAQSGLQDACPGFHYAQSGLQDACSSFEDAQSSPQDA